MSLKKTLMEMAQNTKDASCVLAELSREKKNRILKGVASEIRKNSKSIIQANRKDIAVARKMGLSSAAIDRLTLDLNRISAMAAAVESVAKLADPVGQTLKKWRRPNGLVISKVSVPLGVILVIYESRPNVTSECASLCLKSGNAVILRGGREAFNSNQAIVRIYQKVLSRHQISKSAVSLVPTLDRNAIDELLRFNDLINLVIPRGGEALIRRVVENSRIPVVKHYKGICHVYVDRDADINMALKIAFNAKCQRPGVCNAMETLLVHRAVAAQFLPKFAKMLKEAHCEIRGDEVTRRILPHIKKTVEEDWRTEYLDYILSIRVVRDIDEAIQHIRKYGSAHTDSIVTRNRSAAREFLSKVDSSSVMVNASTRFSDGNQYGFGAEIGISTDKVHARGPMGLEGLVSYKYVVEGTGQIRT
jgi:glutamate-5-semialdehyde dehydrogenase